MQSFSKGKISSKAMKKETKDKMKYLIPIISVIAAVSLIFAAVAVSERKIRAIPEAYVSDQYTDVSSPASEFFSSGTDSFSEAITTGMPPDFTSSEASPGISDNTASTVPAKTEYKYAYAGFNPQYADFNIPDWRLLLVNRDYILPDNYVPDLAKSVESDSDSKLLDSRVAPFYNKMYLAAAEDGIYLTTVSGYRSYQKQETNFENKINTYISKGYGKAEAAREAAKIILPPGTSEHNAGIAMDIISLEQDFENTKAFRWLSENAADYGFILRYPKDKQDVTKIIYEPWHWRFVGVDNAKKIKASGLCLEEYLAQQPTGD